MHEYLNNFKFWCVVIFLFIFVLWVVYGGREAEFKGLNSVLMRERRDLSNLGKPVDLRRDGNYGAPPKKPETIEKKVVDENSHRSFKQYMATRELINTSEKKNNNIQPISQFNQFNQFALPKNNKLSKGQAECHRCIEEIYKKPFLSNVRTLDFLKNPETGRFLELDCYNEELKIAIEYNGIQHYKHPNQFNMTNEAFIKQLRRDELKRELCDNNGVYLITVPYTVKDKDIMEFIKSMLPSNSSL